MIRVEPGPEDYTFTVGGRPAYVTVPLWEEFEVFTEDCFSGRITAVTDRPREVAPFPRVNPLTGPVELSGVRAGDVVAVHLAAVEPARTWGVSTLSPGFGALSGTRGSPNLQPETRERVWIWRTDPESGTVATTTEDGRPLQVPLRPFHGTVAVAPAHGEVRTSTVPDAYGGNLDIPAVAAGATLYLKANTDGALLSIGDGHYAQGDGEFAGTAVEGAMRTRLRAGVLDAAHPDAEGFDWPRLETDDEIIAVGCGRPLEEAVRVALHTLVLWVASACGLPRDDAYQLVSQGCVTRLGNLVNPSYTVTVALSKALLPGAPRLMSGLHDRLRHPEEDR
ncbi:MULTISPECIES: acetamidase/formamidase family protein [Streptomyces]|uniref:acetamidase/formamidase family protein n=1 Tax=Streptomyces TaxID=1883 RepID=UPI00081B32CE|nr:MULTISPECIES: acetamidase/formamidase family protein [unclassified Streptomyces]MYQ54765.1 acetamidase [Streptomyces sp. SID4941]SCE28089.1 Acetamidase/formamidase [Streptomyces sp. PalvLS-984]SDB95231.1 Acetamidase/formamidase [Streptomyces sp. AmelKG-A3]